MSPSFATHASDARCPWLVGPLFSICQLDAGVKDLPNGRTDFSELVVGNDEPRQRKLGEHHAEIYFAADPKNHTWVVTPLHLVGWSGHNLRTNVSSLSSGCGCKLPTHSAQVLRRQPCHVEWFMIHTISTKNKINNEPTELKELS